MIDPRTPEVLASIVQELRALPKEVEWVEFKVNDAEPNMIGECVSALANSAAMLGKPRAYFLWGIENEKHNVIGSTFSHFRAKIGNEELENWLARVLRPNILLEFFEVSVNGCRCTLLEIHPAAQQPVRFMDTEYIRSGSYTKKLRDFPAKAAQLWRSFDKTPFEDRVARDRVPADEVLDLLDHESYFRLVKRPRPETASKILLALADDKLIVKADTGGWNITAVAATLFARNLGDFEGIRRKAVRVIHYKGKSRIGSAREQVGTKGYACGFERLIEYVTGVLPLRESFGKAFRTSVSVYPEVALRELMANALIHQDFFITGAGPTVEIFDDRMEIRNPGATLVDPDRLIDAVPRSRNERLASMMRRIGICEERGQGVDKVVFECEFAQLPAPKFESADESTCATLYTPRSLTRMDPKDRIRACYYHACLRTVSGEFLTNSSLRERFGLDERGSARASVLIREAVKTGIILPHDEAAASQAHS